MDPQELLAVQGFLACLERIERSAALYPPGSSALRPLVDELHEKAQDVLERAKAVELLIGPEEIEYEGEVVYDGSRPEKALAFTLEDGGIRRLVLLDGLERAETEALVEAICESKGRDAEDLVTILWQRDLKHVSHVAVKVYADAEKDSAIDGIDLDRIGAGLVDRLKGRRLSVDQVAAIRGGRGGEGSPEGGATGEGAVDVYALTPAEEAEARRWISDHQDESPAPMLASILTQLVAAARDDDARRRRLRALERPIETLLEDGDFLEAAEALVAVKKLSEAHGGVERTTRQTREGAGNPFKGFFAAVASAENGKRLAKRLARSRDEDTLRAVRIFLLGCGRWAFSLAGELLGVSHHDGAISSALAQAVGGDVADVRERVTDPNARLAAASVRILAEVAGESALEDYRRALGHRDAGVRREAVFALTRCRDPRAVERLVEAFQDPAAEVRSAALKGFPARVPAPRPDLAERLKKLSDDEPAWEARSQSEQELILAAMARLDPDRGLALLKEWAEHYPLLSRERAQKRRHRAIAALGEAGFERAVALLKALAETAKTDESRSACRAALDRAAIVQRSLLAQASLSLATPPGGTSLQATPTPGASTAAASTPSRGLEASKRWVRTADGAIRPAKPGDVSGGTRL